MRTIRMNNLLSSLLIVDDEKKKIIKIHCTCETFEYHCIHKVGKLSHIKYYATPCIHTARVFDALVKNGYTLKVPRIQKGPMRLTPRIRAAVLKVWGKECTHDECHEDENIEIHRVLPGYMGGAYTIGNCRGKCNTHHKLIHSADRRNN